MPYSLNTSFGFRFARIFRAQQCLVEKMLTDFGIRRGCLGIFVALYENDGLSQDALSSLLHVDKAATARSLSFLEEDGFIERSPDPENRRRNIVHLTPRARAIRIDLLSRLGHLNEMAVTDISPEDRGKLLELMDRMFVNIQQFAEKEGRICGKLLELMDRMFVNIQQFAEKEGRI